MNKSQHTNNVSYETEHLTKEKILLLYRELERKRRAKKQKEEKDEK